jgi:hypothetical protein
LHSTEKRSIDGFQWLDGSFVDLDKKSEFVVEDTRYWFGLFSHQRVTSLWKGMLKISLHSDDDKAKSLLG